MTDYRYITALESNMGLEQTMAQNESLRTSNRLLMSLAVLVVVGSVIVVVWSVRKDRRVERGEKG